MTTKLVNGRWRYVFTMQCDHCKKPFTTLRIDKKYCSNKCRTAACRLRHKERL